MLIKSGELDPGLEMKRDQNLGVQPNIRALRKHKGNQIFSGILLARGKPRYIGME